MTDRPILFSGAMVRANLAGTKTQTRRLDTSAPTRRIEIGDRLWVREAWSTCAGYDDVKPSDLPCVTVPYKTRADGAFHKCESYFNTTGKDIWRPSIFMPRWASRLTLIVTDKRHQTLQEIDEDDARAEGVMMVAGRNYRDGYALLWNSLHKDHGTRWDDNPGVIALTYSVHRFNIDEVRI